MKKNLLFVMFSFFAFLVVDSCSITKQLSTNDEEAETLLLKQIKSSLEVCESEVKSLSSDSAVYNAMTTLLASQLASLKYNAEILSSVDNSNVLIEIENCINELKEKEQTESANFSYKEQEQIRKYNRWALNTITYAKENSNGWFKSDNDKISILLDMETIQLNYLYLPINYLYSEVYQEIFKSLKSDNQYEEAKRAINVTKRGLYDIY